MKRFTLKPGLAGTLSIILFLIFAVSAAFGQRAAGGQAAYGKVYEAAGQSAAAQSVKQKLSSSLQSAVLRARRSAAARAANRKVPSRTAPAPARRPAATVAKSSTVFRPDPAVDTTGALADALGTTAEEKQILRQVFSATRTAFEQEVAAKGRRNNLSAAFTFFIGSAAMVYHDDPEPSDEALDELWDGLDAVFNESPDVARLTDREKQEMYDTLVAFSGLILATYMEGKSTGDNDTVQTARQLAGSLMQLILQTDPEKVRFGRDGLSIG